MKKLILAAMFLFAGAITIATAQTAPPVKFNETMHNFGTIPQGKPVSVVFTYVNKGATPLVTATVTSSCPCCTTIPAYSKDAIAPNARGRIKVRFSAEVAGDFTKMVTVKFEGNTAPVVLTIKGNVAAAK